MPASKYLLYCIFLSQRHERHGTPHGVQGQPVSLVSNNGLSAAVSGIPDSELTPDISSVLAYQKVIESFHSHPAVGGVIPMRYGCLFNGQSQVLTLLKECHSQYEALLEELGGCVEMGIRILTPKSLPREMQSIFHRGEISNPGYAYLFSRKARYAQEEWFAEQVNLVFQQCRTAFEGLFVKCKEEYPTIGNLFPSIYFLVPKSSLNRFRQVFRQVEVHESAKLLLSGPWPPYNFVQLDPT